MDKRTGLIVKATGGFYYVQADGVLHECRARGLFRKEGVSPLVGDRVELEPTGEASGYVTAILPRKNALVRPPLANVDTFVIVASVSDPAPNALVIDKLMAIACHKEIRPMLVITKSDLGGPDALEEIYRTVGIPVFAVSRQSDEGLEEIRAALSHGISAFSGNTGVGKSSLLNRIDGRLSIATGETSRKLGRGRHTTRHVELYPIGEDGWIADTPGFSAVDLERYEIIRKEELAGCFPEFAEFSGNCRFTGCSHTVEKGCAVLEALREGKIHPSRHASYRALYEDAKKLKEWELKDPQEKK
ncbi:MULTISPECIES: ribosome small subunit-dependent GTPase A [Anaerotruncus]|uniref:Small ribosomal subunit biogenesis GTPase RsgA n=2 Tax=Anaerotruncus TaxID=244127 RepID=A0A498CYD5_9FIRM|nr:MULTISPECIES: ribosome small subunit-dependent GTPase A [Anaerotruncus]MBC3938884.1 ribosome small subunit-dependent GTPase A [Anaerotruncus massiliensis (ex Togo et al. 2019)]MCQ4895519.1 ribosome small subunit-dependent GTPase A [Anaerotruncus sp. DFI.9.16]RLL10838.1 ribosome small subunit-dependent GTPase A [Anaerotruncus massiliensis (ex Liu et al. 2021)]